MARYQAARETTSNTTHVVIDSATQRPVQDPERGGPLVWDNAEDAAWYAGLRNQLWTHAEIIGQASSHAA